MDRIFRIFRPLSLALAGMLFLQGLSGGEARAQEEYGRILTRLVKLIHLDDSGLRLGYPRKIAYDHKYHETYVLSSTGRVTIYDESYFPQGSIGPGRGAENASGLAVGPGGTLYLSQRKIVDESSGTRRSVVTIYNSALFVEREIYLEDIPGFENFMTFNLDVAEDGTIYLAGYISGKIPDFKGVAVLDSDGNFMEWLAPKGVVLRETAPENPGEEETGRHLERVEDELSILDVHIDVMGRIYLLSGEMGEIHVYDRDRNFLFRFGTKGGAKGKMSQPRALGVDYPRRLVYVVDYMRHTILVHDYDTGRFVYEFGGKGSQPLWYLHPNYIEIDSQGMVIVSDLFNQRVQVVDPTNPDRPVISPTLPESIRAEPLARNESRTEPNRTAKPAAEPPPFPAQPAAISEIAMPDLKILAVKKIPPLPPRELSPGPIKKVIVTMPRPLVRPADLTVAKPGPPAVPPRPAAAAEQTAKPTERAAAGRRRTALRAVIGVYGPVAALVEVGAWLLKRDK